MKGISSLTLHTPTFLDNQARFLMVTRYPFRAPEDKGQYKEPLRRRLITCGVPVLVPICVDDRVLLGGSCISLLERQNRVLKQHRCAGPAITASGTLIRR
jgi:hypothetical protein